MNLDGLSFRVAATAAIGVVGVGTLLHMVQKGSRVFGRYQGGSIVRGCLVGHLTRDTLSFRYSQREREGGIHGGRSTCVLEALADGRVRIHEHFTWSTRQGSGINVFESLTSSAARRS